MIKEIIIKIFKEKEDFKEIAKAVDRLVSAFNGELKSALRESDYENQIYQIGEQKSEVEIIVKK